MTTLTLTDRAKFELIARNALLRLATDAGIPVPHPVIKWDIRGQSKLGTATGDWKIRYHPEAAAITGDAYTQTVIHEACHIHVTALMKQRGVFSRTGEWSAHGYQWQRAMRSLGLRPDRCSSIVSADQLTPARVIPKVKATCGCQTFEITHAKAKNVSRLYCRSCKGYLRLL